MANMEKQNEKSVSPEDSAGKGTGFPNVASQNGVHLDAMHQDVGFRYSRERRLGRASAQVQALNAGTFSRVGFFRSLFTNSSHRMVLFVIVFAFAAFALATRFMGDADGAPQYHALMLGGNFLAMAILPIEELPFLVIAKQAPPTGEFFIGAVDIAVSPVMPRPAEGEAGAATHEVFTQRIFFNLVESESFHISLPFFEESDFFVVLSTGEEQRTFRLQVGEN